MKTILSVLILSLAFAAQAQNDNQMNTGASATPATTTAKPSASGMVGGDGQIAKVLLTLNEGEIDAAQIASHRAKSPEVKDLAKMMISDHKDNMKETKKIAKDNKIDPDRSEMSKNIHEQAEESNKTLKKSDKNSFDKAYVQQQITMHENALSTLNSLIPQVSNPAFKAHLEKTRDKVSQHLAHVQDLKTKIQ